MCYWEDFPAISLLIFSASPKIRSLACLALLRTAALFTFGLRRFGSNQTVPELLFRISDYRILAMGLAQQVYPWLELKLAFIGFYSGHPSFYFELPIVFPSIIADNLEFPADPEQLFKLCFEHLDHPLNFPYNRLHHRGTERTLPQMSSPWDLRT